jgi:hypothetical protein
LGGLMLKAVDLQITQITSKPRLKISLFSLFHRVPFFLL